MNNLQYPDSMFNMRAIFYDRTKRRSKVRQLNKGKDQPKNIRKLRNNFKLRQKPLAVSRFGS